MDLASILESMSYMKFAASDGRESNQEQVDQLDHVLQALDQRKRYADQCAVFNKTTTVRNSSASIPSMNQTVVAGSSLERKDSYTNQNRILNVYCDQSSDLSSDCSVKDWE